MLGFVCLDISLCVGCFFLVPPMSSGLKMGPEAGGSGKLGLFPWVGKTRSLLIPGPGTLSLIRWLYAALLTSM